MSDRKLSLKDAADSKLVKSLTHQDNRAAVIGGVVALAVVAAGLAVLFLTPQGKQARATMSDAATKGFEAGKQAANKGIEAGKTAATNSLEAGKSLAGSTLSKVEEKIPALANLIPVKHNGNTEPTRNLN